MGLQSARTEIRCDGDHTAARGWAADTRVLRFKERQRENDIEDAWLMQLSCACRMAQAGFKTQSCFSWGHSWGGTVPCLKSAFQERKGPAVGCCWLTEGRGGVSQKGGNGPLLPCSLGPQTCFEICYQRDKEGPGLVKSVAGPWGDPRWEWACHLWW